MTLRPILFSIFTLLTCFAALAGQKPTEELQYYLEKYPGEDEVMIHQGKHMKIWLEDNELRTTYKTVETSIFLMDNAKLHSNGQIYHSKNMELVSFEAFTLSPNGNKYKKNPSTDHKEVDFTDNSIFSDDSKETHFVFPGMIKGSKTQQEVNYQINNPRMIPMFLVNPYIRSEKVEFTLEVGNGIEVDITPFHLDPSSVKHTTSPTKNGTTHHWVFDHPKKVKYESDAPAIRYFAPQIAIRIKSYKTDQGRIPVLEDLDGLHDWYCSFVTRTKENDTVLKTLSDSIVGNETSPYEQARKLYQWIQGNVRYIAFEEGDKGLMPAKATEVCQKRFGDCKGMSNALYSLLRAQGIDAHLAWVGTRDIPFTYQELPTPNVDNHMICVAEIDDRYVIMDATNSKVSFDLPSPFIQGKQILVNKECTGYEIITAPECPGVQNLIEQDIHISLTGDTLVGSGVVKFHGYSSMAIKERYRMGAEADLKEEFKGLVALASNKFLLDAIKVEHFDDQDYPLTMRFNFRIPSYVISLDDEVFLNLALDKDEIPEKLEKDRELPVEWRYALTQKMKVTLDLKDQFDVVSTPADSRFANDQFGHSIQFDVLPGKVIRETTHGVNTLVLEPAHFEQWNDYVKAHTKGCSEQIVLKRK